MAEPLDLTALRTEIEDHLGELPQNVTCCPGCRTALEDGPALVAEVERLRAELARVRKLCGEYTPVPPPLFRDAISQWGQGMNHGTKTMAEAVLSILDGEP